MWQATVERLYDDWDCGVWDIPNVKSQHPEKTVHPCQFPVELAERCVLALTNKGDIVYDPFAGVGSSLIAALKNERVAYGTELKQEYVDIGLRRIEKLGRDDLKTRPIYQRIYEPSGKDAVSQYPTEWLTDRARALEELQKSIKKEMLDVKKEIKAREKIKSETEEPEQLAI